jgi:predicted metal-dependent peptidase
MRVSRTGWDIDAVLPGQKVDEELKIAVAIDMSGSISEQMGRDLLSEVVGIMDQFPSYEILVMTYDTEIYNPQVFTNDNSEDIKSYKIMGGGGTDYNCIYDYLKQEDITPMKLINATDGFPGSGWGDEHYCDTLFLLSGTKTIIPPFGVYTYLD